MLSLAQLSPSFSQSLKEQEPASRFCNRNSLIKFIVYYMLLAAMSSSRSDTLTHCIRLCQYKEFFLSLKSFNGVSRKLKEGLKFKECFKKVSRILKRSFKVCLQKVSRLFPECFNDDWKELSGFEGDLKEVEKVCQGKFQWCFKDVSNEF